ncbi:response regulator transcription factor [Pseudonocardia sp. TRM90224]|uniref:response regulator transcription factor n=1 Tax=Pseudonocardia sp. TRM90224 TaxID=2812678 RepID=UPI001E31DEE1|nr:response regulator transcription factor [Pseudonocardia sp. TRM90224]
MRALLIANDDRDRGPLAESLIRHRLDLTIVRRGMHTLDDISATDVVLFELGLPDFDGLMGCRAIRAASRIPIVTLTVRSGIDERNRSIRNGADSFVVGPFAVGELIARIVAARRHPPRPRIETVCRRDDVVVHLLRQHVTVAGTPVLLSRKEYQILAMICVEDGAICSRERIVAENWNPGWLGVDNTLNVHVATMRSKLGRPGLIETVRGSGYRLAGTRPGPPLGPERSNGSAARIGHPRLHDLAIRGRQMAQERWRREMAQKSRPAESRDVSNEQAGSSGGNEPGCACSATRVRRPRNEVGDREALRTGGP